MSYWLISNSAVKAGVNLVEVITCDASANTKGAWTEFIASTLYQGYVSITFIGASLNYSHLVDIGIGAEGSEVVILSNLNFEWSPAYGIAQGPVIIPILIAKGTRVSCRAQCSTASSKVVVASLNLLSINDYVGAPLFSIEETYGANTGDSGGTSIDPGDTASTWGSWVELSASCGKNIRGIMFGATPALNHTRSDAYHYVRLGIGSSGNEVVVAGMAMRQHGTIDTITPQLSGLIPVSIPAATRLSLSAYCTINDAADRLCDVILYTFS